MAEKVGHDGCSCGGDGACCAPGSCALAELGQGECAVVQASGLADADAALLKAMGLRPDARVRVCRRGEPCIVEIGVSAGASCRIGLARSIAERVVVRREAMGAVQGAAPGGNAGGGDAGAMSTSSVSPGAAAGTDGGLRVEVGVPDADAARHKTHARYVLLGNPNTGKTTLFNHLTGLRHKTSNFPGTTQEARVGQLRALGNPGVSSVSGGSGGAGAGGGAGPGAGSGAVEIVDLPGIYSLGLDQPEAKVCRDVLRGALALPGRSGGGAGPDGAMVVADATNLARNLTLVGETLREGLPTAVAVNMIDCARRDGVEIDGGALSRELGCPVELVCARSGEGVDRLPGALRRGVEAWRAGERAGSVAPIPADDDGLAQWAALVAHRVSRRSSDAAAVRRHSRTDRVDRVLTHPALGLLAFTLVMTGLFWVIFSLARFPMGWIDGVFASLGALLRAGLPAGFVRDLLAEGVVTGVGATLVFLPQICLLFFLISLLEDSGYLARAAFVTDRLLRPFGLSGHSFVPLLSSHACALPGIMACRGVPDPRERLAAILVAPFMSCTARMPVYVLLVTILFPGRPLLQAVAFTGCYALGAIAGLLSALVARRTIVRGQARAMALELPSYKAPSALTAGIAAYDRGLLFLKKAGTNILAICVILWWLGAYPKPANPPEEATRMRAQAAGRALSDAFGAGEMRIEADRMEARAQARGSYVGRLGAAIEPVVRPLGYDRQLAVGVLASFAAREVFVSTMAVVTSGEQAEKGEAGARGVAARLAGATRDDGVTPVFTGPAAWSLLVYYVLAMQCLPTLAVTAREAGGVRWALLQLAWMCGLAYALAFVAFRVASAAGGV